MMRSGWKTVVTVLCAAICLAGAALAQQVSFKDPTGDDFGPGNYVYPTDSVYKAGSFDLTSFKMEIEGKKGTVEVGVNSALEDPWGMKTGFAVQMVFVFIDTDHKEGSGFTDGIPGLNVKFAPADAWDKLIVLSPQPAARVRTEVETKAITMKDAVIVPNRTKGSGRTISGSFDAEALGGGDPSTWGYQVVMQSNEGFPDFGRRAHPAGQRVRGPASLRWRQRRHVRPARNGPPGRRWRRRRGRDRGAEGDAQVRVQPGRQPKRMAVLTMVRK